MPLPSAQVRESRHIAIADDDRDTRDLLKLTLAERGYAVTVVPNGLRLLAALQIDKPGLVILDVNMSWIDGFELCRGMKRNPEYKDIPVIFISGKTSEADVARGLACGAVGYLKKPFTLNELMTQVEAVFSASQHG
jgi:DNA-binding response OmpR family regulator